MNPISTRRTITIAAAAILLASFRSIAGAAVLQSITVEPPVVHMRPCEVVLLEITGHYDDGTARDLQLEFGLTFTFAEGIAQRAGTRTVVNNVGLDDILTVSLDGVDSAPVPLVVVTPEDRSRCVGGGTTTTTSPQPTTTSSTTTTSTTITTTTTTTTEPSTPTTTPGSSSTTSTLPPEEEDPACDACVHERVQHRLRIENHVIFHGEQVLEDRCGAAEYPLPLFQVAADGTASSVFEVTQVVEGSCQTTLTEPIPYLLDDDFLPIANPDPAFYGTLIATDRRLDFVRFEYTHPTTPPANGEKFRIVRIGIFYIDRSNPGAGERRTRILEIEVYRPPVLMIHGLWSDANAFAVMERTLAATNYEPFQLFRLDYGRTNDSSFDVNLPIIAGGVRAVIQGSANADLATGKVDLVTHSMGGVLSRLYLQSPGYQHEVRRLITSNTPHAGSQMANLLLDSAADPQGLVCGMLSQLMSSAAAPDRGCHSGAVEDMRVSSLATADLNLGVHPTDVAVHAVATVFDVADLPDLSFVGAVGGTAGFLTAELVRACAISFIDEVFNSDDSDLIVSETSQSGGLGGTFRSFFPGQPHMEVGGPFPIPGPVANVDVVERVKSLLNEPDDSSSFTRSGYTPGRLTYTTPSLCPLFLPAKTLGAGSGAVATGVAVTSPSSGTTASPGESIAIEVAGSPDIASVLLVLSQPGDEMVLAEQPGPDARFDLEIPEKAVGLQNVVVGGFDASGRLVAVSDTVTIDVIVPSALNGITVYPPVVHLQPCATASLEVTGHYEDGVARDLSEHPGLSLTFATGNAAQSATGVVVLNEAADDTLIVTFDGVDSAPIPIRALVPDGFGSCGTETTTTTTIVSPSTTTTVPSCEDVAGTGLAGAECLLSAALAEPLCPAGTIAPKLERFATTKLQRALDRVQKAALTVEPRRQQRLVRKATRALGKILRHNPGTTSEECLQLLTAMIDDVLDTLEAD